MSEHKRKGGPPGGPDAKRKKGGNSGKWQTSHQRNKGDQRGAVEVGQTGIWVTCARSQEAKAAREVQLLFDEYAEKLYNVVPRGDAASDDEDADEDIEASIQRELTSMKPSRAERPTGVFTVLRQSVDCLMWVKTREPIEPVEFVHRICLDAKVAADPKQTRSRYVNRLTPITLVGRATDKGVEEVCQKVLPQWFTMKPTQGDDDQEAEEAEGGSDKSNGSAAAVAAARDDSERPAYSYAIRIATRNQCPLKRGDIINQIAGMIDPRHKVNLSNPDKVILVDMYQNVYGMSVADGDWESLKKYNISELYTQAASEAAEPKQEELAEREAATKDQAQPGEPTVSSVPATAT